MSEIRTTLTVAAAKRMSEEVAALGTLSHQIGADGKFGIADLAVRLSRYERTVALAIAANVCATDWTESDLRRQLDKVRDEVRDAWRAWVLKATVKDEQEAVQAVINLLDEPADKLVGWDLISS
jgi:hypothetical protein